MAGTEDGYEYSRNPKGEGWEYHETVITPKEGYHVYRRAIPQPNNFPQPGNHANAPGIVVPQTQPYSGPPPEQKASAKTPGLPPGVSGIDDLEKYVNAIPAGEIRAESAAILVELGDYGTGRTIPGGTPGDYARRDHLKTALELLKEKVNKGNIDPKEVPELGDYAVTQLTTVFAAALSGALVRVRGKGKPSKACAC